jgi:pantothenate kinase
LKIYPRLLVSIGSGVSVIKVSSDTKFERVGGSMIGGGTLIGLSNLLLNVNDFSQIQEMSRKGNNANIDTLVKDLYGANYDGLDGETIGTSFGKIASISLDVLKHK